MYQVLLFRYLTEKSNYKETINLPKSIHDIIFPISNTLSNDDLLAKCVHGETQNPNETFNHIVWTICPKTIYVNLSVLD